MKTKICSLFLALLLVVGLALPLTAAAEPAGGEAVRMEKGAIAVYSTEGKSGIKYTNNTAYIRTANGYLYQLDAGDTVRLSDYSDGTVLKLFITTDGMSYSIKTMRSGVYTAPSQVYIAFIINKSDLVYSNRLQFSDTPEEVLISDLVDYEVEVGGIALNADNSIKYANNAKCVRTTEGYLYKLKTGRAIGLKDYTDARMALYFTQDGQTFTSKPMTAGTYIAEEDTYVAFVIISKTGTIQTDTDDFLGLLNFVPEENPITIDELTHEAEYQLEVGGISMSNGALNYAPNAKRVRTEENYVYEMSAGNTIGLSDYSDAYMILYTTTDGETFTAKQVKSGVYTARGTVYVAFVIVYPEIQTSTYAAEMNLDFEKEGDAILIDDIAGSLYQVESGGIALNADGSLKYAANSKRIRTEEGYVYKLSAGNTVGLDDYSDGTYLILFHTEDGETYTMKAVRSGSYTAAKDEYFAFVIVFPDAQTDLSGASRLAFTPEEDAVLASSLTEIREFTYTLTVDSDFCAIQYTVTYDTDVYQFVSAEYPMFLDASGEDYIGSFTYHDASDADQPMIGVIKANCAKAVDDLCCEDGEQIIKLRVKCLADAPVVVPQTTIVRLADIAIMQGDVGQNLDYTWSYTFTNVATGAVLASDNG